jgi:predicted membrane channel-forming protein YqfA (hemolysin III family)
MIIPAAFCNLTTFAAVTLVVANGTALLLLIAGLLLDNVLVWPDVLYNDVNKRKGQKPLLLCHNTRCGCIMNSHAWWHVFTLVSVVLQTVGREIAIQETLRMSNVP